MPCYDIILLDKMVQNTYITNKTLDIVSGVFVL